MVASRSHIISVARAYSTPRRSVWLSVCALLAIACTGHVDPDAEGRLVGEGAQAALVARDGQELHFKIAVPDGLSELSFETRGANGNADLYLVSAGAPDDKKPSPDYFDHKSVGPDSNENITIANPKSGTYRVLVYAARGFNGVDLNINFGKRPPVDPPAPPPPPKGPCSSANASCPPIDLPCMPGTPGCTKSCGSVDLLVIVDSSNSMTDDQDLLAAELPKFIDGLVHGDSNRDGTKDFDPPADLHIGVTTTDLGLAGYSYSYCPANEPLGDEGVLRSRAGTRAGGNGDVTVPAECSVDIETAYGHRYISWTPAQPGSHTLGQVSADASCIVRQGDRGCGFEQPFESMLKAVVPSSDMSFMLMSGGEGDTNNSGFFRKDALLAVLLITDEDDCSVRPDKKTFLEVGNGDYGGAQTRVSRCTNTPDALQSMQRYVDGLTALKGEYKDRIVFGAIAGLPPSLLSKANAGDYTGILSSDEMTVSLVTGGSDGDPYYEVQPSCCIDRATGQPCPTGAAERAAYQTNHPGAKLQTATPPRRTIDFLRRLGGDTVLRSICEPNYTDAMGAVLRKIAGAMPRTCKAN